MATAAIPQYDQPITYKLTYHMPGGCVKQKSQFGQILPNQNSIYMGQGDTLSLSLPETRDAGESWTMTCDSKSAKIQIKDNGFIKSAKAGADGGSGVHNFLVQLSGSIPEATPFHLVLNRMGKAIAEKTLNVMNAHRSWMP